MGKYAILAVILGITILSYFYLQLGGMSDVQKGIVTIDSYLLVGKSFKGKYNSPQLEKIFYQVKKMGGHLVVINYPLQGDSTKRGFVYQVIGTQVKEGLKNIPIGLHQRTIPTYRAVQARIDVHNLIMPKPKDIEEKLRTYAKKQDFSLENYVIERYLSNRELVIEIPILE